MTLYVLFVLAIILSGYAQFKVSGTFRKYSRTGAACGRSAAEVAEMILRENGIHNVKIERVGGNLTDHFDPTSNTLRLSDSVYSSSSAAAVGVAAHEAGHAVQHAVGYFPIRLRSALVPITSFASKFAWIAILLGSLFMFAGGLLGEYVMLGGIGLFAVTTVFQLVTLPCEFDASSRALKALEQTGLYSKGELAQSRQVLSAAALTYVAALFTSIIQLLRLVVRFSNNRRR